MTVRGVIIFIFLFSTSCVAQSSESIVDSIYNATDSNTSKLHELIALLNSRDTISPSENIGYLYHKIGLLYNKDEKFKKAIAFTKKAVFNRTSLIDIDTLKLNRSLNNIYFYYKNLNETDSCQSYLIKIIGNNSTDKFTLDAYYRLASIASDNGDYFKALEYLEKFFFLSKKSINNSTKYHKKCIYVYSKMGNFKLNEKSILYHKNEAEKLRTKKNDAKFASMYNNLANYYDDIGKTTKAIAYYKKALKYFIHKNNTIEIGNIYNNIGAVYAAKKDFKNAHLYFNKGLIITKNKSVWARIYDNQGYYLQTKNPINKIIFYKKAINCFMVNKNFNNNNTSEILAIKNANDKLDVLGYLVDLANEQVIAYEDNKNIDFLESAKKNILLIDKLVSNIRSGSSTEKSKLFWINNGVDTYMLGVKICYLLNDVDTAFYFMEKNKSLLLLENISVNSLNKILKISSLEACAKKLVSPKSCFAEYILNKKDGYGIFYANNSAPYFYQLKNIDTLLKNVDTLKLMCTKPFKTENDFKIFKTLSFNVFNTLFPFENALRFISKKKLIIISDFKLQNLAFETLSTSLNKDNNYLILNTEISYLQSFSVLNQILKKTRNATKDILAIAPSSFKDSTLISLPSNVEKLFLNTSLSKTLLLNKYATKDSFIDALNNYKIIHINTHAGINPKNKTPWIAFWDENLFLQEIYNNKNQADLIILDACNSASGNLAVGEGILSLSRGFFLTGTKSVIASLWNVNVKSTNNILASFYEELSNDNSKSNALHIAKISYLKNAQTSEKSPYYWASIILTGDSDYIKLKEKKSLSPFLLLFLLPVSLFIYKWFYSKKILSIY